jgi:hypothetical protein
MTKADLTKLGLKDGIWHGLLTCIGDAPEISVTHKGTVLADVQIVPAEQDGRWTLRVPVPSEAIADGVQIFFIHDLSADEPLGSFYLVAGDGDEDDLRAEVELLRAELDMLKRAFRRHCLETMG